jgi:hypothetical protein
MELQTLVKIIARHDRELLVKLSDFALETDGDTLQEDVVLDLLAGLTLNELEAKEETK